jgi:hypothetical protein
MKLEDYPGLYGTASASSARAQLQYLWLIGVQYGLLLLAAIAALGFEISTWFSALYAIILIASTVLLLVTAFVKPEKNWYASRALAESLKTSTWRYMMNAQPFDFSVNSADAKDRFINLLKEISDANTYVRDVIRRQPTSGPAITSHMNSVRTSLLSERMSLYLAERIIDQRKWYVLKANNNKRSFVIFVILGVVIQSAAVILALLRFKDEVLLPVWPTEPMLVLAAAIIGWTQIKKFNELASAYSLTAHEISLIEAKADTPTTEVEWSDFVNEAELAFSREHTQWVARQDS